MEKFELIDKQIEALKSSGLKFKDEQKAREIILRENYYYLTTGYDDIFLNLKKTTDNQEMYEEETYFEELYAIYNLDRDLRNLILDYINIVEVNMKSYIAYVFTQKYGEKNFLKRENFRDGFKYNQKYDNLIKQINENLERNIKNEESDLKQYLDKNKNLPLWVLVKVFTFGNMSAFYHLMNLDEKEKVADIVGVGLFDLEKYLVELNIVRNICAHNDILFNARVNEKNLFQIVHTFEDILDEADYNKMYSKIKKIIDDVRPELDNLSFKNLINTMGFLELNPVNC